MVFCKAIRTYCVCLGVASTYCEESKVYVRVGFCIRDKLNVVEDFF